MLWNLIYQIPVMMSWGAHWALKPNEAADLTAATQSLLKTVPDKQRQVVMELLDKYVPLTTFIGTVAITTYPRYITTQAMVSQIKGTQERNNVSPINRRNDGPSTTGTNQTAVRYIEDDSPNV